MLGSEWPRLPEAVRRAHSTGSGLTARGSFRIERGAHPLAAVVARLLRLPGPTPAATVQLRVAPDGDGEAWIRRMDGDRLVTRQRSAGPGLLAERIGAIEFQFRLDVSAVGLVYRQQAALLAIGSRGVPLSARLAPRVEATEEALDRTSTRVSVRVTLPLIGLLVAYAGTMDFGERVS